VLSFLISHNPTFKSITNSNLLWHTHSLVNSPCKLLVFRYPEDVRGLLVEIHLQHQPCKSLYSHHVSILFPPFVNQFILIFTNIAANRHFPPSIPRERTLATPSRHTYSRESPVRAYTRDPARKSKPLDLRTARTRA
jgi:hypothetical protein